MTEQDRKRFAVLLMALSDTYNEPVSETRASVYFSALSDFPIEDLERAAQRLLRSSEFFPRPAAFVALLEGDAADHGEMALARIAEEVRRTGYYGQPRLSEADYRLVCQVWGGWEAVCSSLPAKGTEAFQWERKRFLEFHAAATNQARMEHPALTKGEASHLLEQIKGGREGARDAEGLTTVREGLQRELAGPGEGEGARKRRGWRRWPR